MFQTKPQRYNPYTPWLRSKNEHLQDRIEYFDGGIKIGSNIYHIGDSVNIGVDVSVRTKGMTNYELNHHVNRILSVCPGTVYGRLTQLFARTKYGDFDYQKERNTEHDLYAEHDIGR